MATSIDFLRVTWMGRTDTEDGHVKDIRIPLYILLLYIMPYCYMYVPLHSPVQGLCELHMTWGLLEPLDHSHHSDARA